MEDLTPPEQLKNLEELKAAEKAYQNARNNTQQLLNLTAIINSLKKQGKSDIQIKKILSEMFKKS